MSGVSSTVVQRPSRKTGIGPFVGLHGPFMVTFENLSENGDIKELLTPAEGDCVVGFTCLDHFLIPWDTGDSMILEDAGRIEDPLGAWDPQATYVGSENTSSSPYIWNAGVQNGYQGLSRMSGQSLQLRLENSGDPATAGQLGLYVWLATPIAPRES